MKEELKVIRAWNEKVKNNSLATGTKPFRKYSVWIDKDSENDTIKSSIFSTFNTLEELVNSYNKHCNSNVRLKDVEKLIMLA